MKIVKGITLATCFIISIDLYANTSKPCTSEKTTLNMKMCLAKLNKKLDNNLNARYKKLINLVKYKNKLRSAEKSWLNFRGKECNFSAAKYQGGSIQPVIRQLCFINLTKNRIKQLEKHIKSYNL